MPPPTTIMCMGLSFGRLKNFGKRQTALRVINRAAGKRKTRPCAFDNLLDGIGEVLLVRQPCLPVSGFGEAIDHNVDGTVVKPVDKNQARHSVIADEVWIV